eukprot:4784391-Pyramimonas_sp.AAC.1
MTTIEWETGMAQEPQDGGMRCTRLNWDGWISDRSFLPHLHSHAELTELVRTDRLGQIAYLRRAPKRRAGPAWGVLSEALGMRIDYR